MNVGKFCNHQNQQIEQDKQNHLVFAFSEQFSLAEFVDSERLADSAQQLAMERLHGHWHIIHRRLNNQTILRNKDLNERINLVHELKFSAVLCGFVDVEIAAGERAWRNDHVFDCAHHQTQLVRA